MDDDLRAAFERIREADARGAPSFRELVEAGNRRRPVRIRWAFYLPVAAAISAAIALAIVLRPPAGTPPVDVQRAEIGVAVSGWWEAPTDFLMATPGSEIVSGTPALGGSSSALVWMETRQGERNEE